MADPAGEIDVPEKAPEEFETAVGGESRLVELEGQITVDTAMKIRFSLSHKLWPFVRGRVALTLLIYQTNRPYFKGKGGTASCGPPFSALGFLSH
jgi:hypothetical protein